MMEMLFEGTPGNGEKELPTTIKSEEELAKYSVRQRFLQQHMKARE